VHRKIELMLITRKLRIRGLLSARKRGGRLLIGQHTRRILSRLKCARQSKVEAAGRSW
jgi:hypothetical protein